MKIAVIGLRGFPNVIGGVEAHAENLYPHLVAKGCEVVVFTRRPYVDTSLTEYKGVKLVHLASLKNRYLETFFHTFLSVFAAGMIRPDILHVHAIGPSLSIPAARLLGMKVVMTHHGPDYERQKWGRMARFVLRAGERAGCRWANRIICISNPIAASLKEKYECAPFVVPNGVNVPGRAYDPDKLKKYGLENGKYVLAVGRFVPEKGLHDLIRAFRLFRQSQCSSQGAPPEQAHKDWKLAIAGDTTHYDAYSSSLKAEAAGDGDIVLTGFLSGERLHEVYAHAGLFVLPSYYEGLPIALLEAMSHGLSCIVSDIPAHRTVELPQDRYFGAGDVDGLSLKIRAFIDNPLPEWARQEEIRLVAERFAWPEIASMTMEVYESIV